MPLALLAHRFEIWGFTMARCTESPPTHTGRCICTGYNIDEAVSILVFHCWEIWKQRNKFCMEGKSIDIQRALIHAKCNKMEFSRALPMIDRSSMRLTQRSSSPVSFWSPPQSNEVKFNIDAAYLNNSQATFAFLGRSCSGHVCFGHAATVRCSSPAEAEAHAIRSVSLFAKQLQITNITIESDAEQ